MDSKTYSRVGTFWGSASFLCEDEAKSAWGAEAQQGNLLWGWEPRALRSEKAAAGAQDEVGIATSGPGQAQRTRPWVPPAPGMQRNSGWCCVDWGIPVSPPNLRDTSVPYLCFCSPRTLQEISGRQAGVLSIFSKERLGIPTCAISITALSYAFNRCEH